MNPSRDFVRFAGTLTGKVPFRANDAALRSPDRLGSFGRMLVWGKGEPVANRADRPLLDPLEKLRKGHVESPCDTLEHVDAGIALARFDFTEVSAFDVDHIGKRDLRQSVLLSQKTDSGANSFSCHFSHRVMVSLAVSCTVFDRTQLALSLGNEHV